MLGGAVGQVTAPGQSSDPSPANGQAAARPAAVIAGPARTAMLAAYENSAPDPETPIGASAQDSGLAPTATPDGPVPLTSVGTTVTPATIPAPGSPQAPKAPQVVYPLSPRLPIWPSSSS